MYCKDGDFNGGAQPSNESHCVEHVYIQILLSDPFNFAYSVRLNKTIYKCFKLIYLYNGIVKNA